MPTPEEIAATLLSLKRSFTALPPEKKEAVRKALQHAIHNHVCANCHKTLAAHFDMLYCYAHPTSTPTRGWIPDRTQLFTPTSP